MKSAAQFEEEKINQAFNQGQISQEERDKLLSDIVPELFEDLYQSSLVHNTFEMDHYRAICNI